MGPRGAETCAVFCRVRSRTERVGLRAALSALVLLQHPVLNELG